MSSKKQSGKSGVHVVRSPIAASLREGQYQNKIVHSKKMYTRKLKHRKVEQ